MSELDWGLSLISKKTFAIYLSQTESLLGWPVLISRADLEGGTVGPYPLKNHKDIEFLSQTDLDPLKNLKAT